MYFLYWKKLTCLNISTTFIKKNSNEATRSLFMLLGVNIHINLILYCIALNCIHVAMCDWETETSCSLCHTGLKEMYVMPFSEVKYLDRNTVAIMFNIKLSIIVFENNIINQTLFSSLI